MAKVAIYDVKLHEGDDYIWNDADEFQIRPGQTFTVGPKGVAVVKCDYSSSCSAFVVIKTRNEQHYGKRVKVRMFLDHPLGDRQHTIDAVLAMWAMVATPADDH